MPRDLKGYANFGFRNELPRARGGIEAKGIGIERLELGTTLFRVTSCPYEPLPSPNAFTHVAAYDAAMAKYRLQTSQSALQALTKGCWWNSAKHVYEMKAQSLQQNKHLGSIARVANAVKFRWSRMDHLVTAAINTPQGLFAFRGKGQDMRESLEVGGQRVDVVFLADPNIDQLYIPGLWQSANVAGWLRILDVQHIGGDTATSVLGSFGDSGNLLARHRR
jgi:hypothetical protein